MYDYLIHSGSGIDDPKLIGGADTIEEARAIANRELEQWPDQIVTIIDRWDGRHSINPPGRPTKPDAEKFIRINITLSPDALTLVDAQAETQGTTRSALIAQLITDRWG